MLYSFKIFHRTITQWKKADQRGRASIGAHLESANPHIFSRENINWFCTLVLNFDYQIFKERKKIQENACED